jgi:hypothetical protein
MSPFIRPGIGEALTAPPYPSHGSNRGRAGGGDAAPPEAALQRGIAAPLSIVAPRTAAGYRYAGPPRAHVRAWGASGLGFDPQLTSAKGTDPVGRFNQAVKACIPTFGAPASYPNNHCLSLTQVDVGRMGAVG